MFDFDDGLTNFFDKTAISENQNIPLQRGARDTKTNTSGYWLIDTCKNNNLFITNGRVGKDKGVGHKTFRGTSTSDYTVCTANCFEFLTQFEVIDLDPIFSNGHALLSWSFKTNKTAIPHKVLAKMLRCPSADGQKKMRTYLFKALTCKKSGYYMKNWTQVREQLTIYTN